MIPRKLQKAIAPFHRSTLLSSKHNQFASEGFFAKWFSYKEDVIFF